jgi:hypothetical protein
LSFLLFVYLVRAVRYLKKDRCFSLILTFEYEPCFASLVFQQGVIHVRPDSELYLI